MILCLFSTQETTNPAVNIVAKQTLKGLKK